MVFRRSVPLVLLALISVPLYAQLNRSAVSVNGSDVNPCTVNAPCRSFGAALAVTNFGGEILALDSGGFGPFLIDRPVTVVAPEGVHAAITAIGTDAVGVLVGAGVSSRVRIIGLSISGSGSVSTGILIQSAERVYVDRVTVDGFSRGIVTETAASLFVTDSTVRDATMIGIGSLPGTGLARVVADRSRAFAITSGIGFLAGEGTTMTVRDSMTALNETGFAASSSDALRPASLAIVGSQTTDNTSFGIRATGSSATIRVSRCLIGGNATAVSAILGAQILSAGDNLFSGNIANGAFTGTTPLQ